MNQTDKNRDYTPLLCAWQMTIITAPADHVRIANLLAIACRIKLNGGRFANALTEWESERMRMVYGIGADEWNTIKAACSGFWHFEGRDLVVDFYSTSHEQTLLSRSNAARKGALHRWRRSKTKNIAKRSVNATAHADAYPNAHAIKEISPKGDISNGPSPLEAGGAFDDEGHPCTPQATPEEIETIFGEAMAHGQNR